MAFEDQNQLIIKHENLYYNRVTKNGNDPYDRELEPGNYQFVTLQTVMDQFMISYVGKDKIIPTINKLDVQFHALRGLAEFSYDILRSHKGFEFTLPPSLRMILPQDFVAYTQVSWSDSAGIKHPIHFNNDTSDPRNPYQNTSKNSSDDNIFSVHAIGTTTIGSSFIELDGLYPMLFAGINGFGNCKVKHINPGLFSNMVKLKNVMIYGVWHDKATQKTTIQILDTVAPNTPTPTPTSQATASATTELEFYWEDVTGTAPEASTFNLAPTLALPILFNPVFTTTSNRIDAASPGDVANIKRGMKIVAANDYFNTSNGFVIDVDYVNGYVYVNKGLGSTIINYPFQNSTTPPTGSTFTAVPSLAFYDENQLAQNAQRENAGAYLNEESDTLKGFKGSSNSSNDLPYDEIKALRGGRYGIDPQRAQVNGTFYIDQNKGTMRFSSDLVGKTIVIDYISDSLGQRREQIVHKFAEEAIYKWIAHAVLATRSNTPEYLVARFKKERFAEMRKAKLRLQNINFKEFTQILRGKSKQIKH